MRYEKLVESLEGKTGKDKKTIERIIEDKRLEFGGLISAEGAAHIIAKEFGITISDREMVKINEIKSSPITVEGIVSRVLGFREFEKNGRKGKVANIILADETGNIKTVLWDKDAELVFLGKLKEGSAIRIVNGIVKERDGLREVSPGRFGSIEETKLDIKTKTTNITINKSKISNLSPDTGAEIHGCVIRVFETKPFFNDKGKEALMVSCVIDDGSGSIRCVFFREVAEKLLGMKTEDVLREHKSGNNDWAKSLLGKEITIKGRVKMSSFSDSIEIIGSDISEIEPKAAAKELLQGLR